MRSLGALLRSMFVSIFAVALLAAPTFAQSSPAAPAEKPGLCAPWHRCIAGVFMLTVILYVAFVGLGYLIQRKGFDRVEHRQGNPDGVPVDRR